jgi:hypothetical protein
VHGATAIQVSQNAALRGALKSIMVRAQMSPAVKALAKQDQYGAFAVGKDGEVNPQEIVAESQANPRFQQALRNSPSPKNPGKSLYDDYKAAVGNALSLPPTAFNHPVFDKILDGNGPSVA